MWEVDGLYSRVCCKRFKIARVTMVDKYVSENGMRNPRVRNGIDFRKGDFSDEEFVSTLEEPYDLALAYDVLPTRWI
ncbi:MAG: class I SAM-dependent methyltransferase [Thermoproteota archaeon]